MAAIELLKPEAAVLTPSYAAHLVEWASEREIDLARLECRARARRGRAGWRRARASAPSSRKAGARASPRRWGSATSASRSGASARSRTACTSVRAASSIPSSSIPRRASRCELARRRVGRARPHASPPPRCSAPALPHARPGACAHVALCVRAYRAARSLHRSHRRHAHRARRQRLPVGDPRGRRRIRAVGQRPHSHQARGRPG